LHLPAGFVENGFRPVGVFQVRHQFVRQGIEMRKLLNLKESAWLRFLTGDAFLFRLRFFQ
jgi:hypothetical protein